jgi:hypothetical protein
MYIRKNLEPVWYYGMVVVVFKSVSRLEIHWNNIVFIFKKFIFNISTSKRYENINKNNLKQIKKS